MSVQNNDAQKNLKDSTNRLPEISVPLAPLRPIAQRGYYTLIVLTLLFSTIQQTTGPIRASTHASKSGQTNAPEMCRAALQASGSRESSSCDFEEGKMVLMDLPIRNYSNFLHGKNKNNQVAKPIYDESIETQKGERHVNNQSRQI